jgi:hypothetical protein
VKWETEGIKGENIVYSGYQKSTPQPGFVLSVLFTYAPTLTGCRVERGLGYQALLYLDFLRNNTETGGPIQPPETGFLYFGPCEVRFLYIQIIGLLMYL